MKMAKLTLNPLNARDFFNDTYWKSEIKNQDEFIQALQEYNHNLRQEKAKKSSENNLVKNVLVPFFQKLGFDAKENHQQKNAPANSTIDLALMKNGKVSVIIETKAPNNHNEMISRDELNKKALHEAILYYYREYTNELNSRVKFIIITNFTDFYIFKEEDIRQVFYNETARKFLLKKKDLLDNKKQTAERFYQKCEELIENKSFLNSIIDKIKFDEKIDDKGNIIIGNKTPEFFDEQGEFIEIQPKINVLHLNLSLFNSDNHNAKAFYKLFLRDFLLGEFSHDPNKISKKFYTELLYLLGLKEEKDGKLTNANISGSLLDNICRQFDIVLDSKKSFDDTIQLVILWLNRILFLKLMETNLINFNFKVYKELNQNNKKSDKQLRNELKFLKKKYKDKEDKEIDFDFDTLNEIFFSVLAKPLSDKNRQSSAFSFLPYLNSSIFQKDNIEKNREISVLDNNAEIEIYTNTNLLDANNKKRTGKIKFTQYLLEFLDSFDFGEIEQNLSGNLKDMPTHSELISSAVLGQVFEKLNGYKDGSFYTPAFITEYICKQTIDNFVLQRFSEKFGKEFETLDHLKEFLKDEKWDTDKYENAKSFYDKCNELIDNMKICDPAVGSGYFLVSALNYLIFLKSKLGILVDEHSKRLDAEIDYEFDELVVKEYDGSRFHYTRPKGENEPQHIIQKTLFQEKAKIIENCLFGVDINPNSCEIARLRLWIELLKHAYFIDFSEPNPTKQNALETLPNIDINIKCGNSLVSYFPIDTPIQNENAQKSISIYLQKVNDYKKGIGNKNELDEEIRKLKEQYKKLFFLNDENFKKQNDIIKEKCEQYTKLYGDYGVKKYSELTTYFEHMEFDLFIVNLNDQEIKKAAEKELDNLLVLYKKTFNLDDFYPFEWRFEFPEILDEKGNFTGFEAYYKNKMILC